MKLAGLVTVLFGLNVIVYADVTKPTFDLTKKTRRPLNAVPAPAPVDLSVRVSEEKIDAEIIEAKKVISELGRGPLDELPEAFEIEDIRRFNFAYQHFNVVWGDPPVEPWQWPGPWKVLVYLWSALEKTAPTLSQALSEITARYRIVSPIGGAKLLLDHYAVANDAFTKWLSVRETPERYQSLGVNDRDRLSRAVAKIRGYVSRFVDGKENHSFLIPLDDGPQFIKRELAIFIGDEFHTALVVKYNRGRRDD